MPFPIDENTSSTGPVGNYYTPDPQEGGGESEVKVGPTDLMDYYNKRIDYESSLLEEKSLAIKRANNLEKFLPFLVLGSLFLL